MKESSLPMYPHEIGSHDETNLSNKVEMVLRGMFNHAWPEGRYRSFKLRVEGFVGVNDFGVDDIMECWNASGVEDLPGEVAVNFFFSMLYYICAIKALEQGEDVQGLTLLAHSTYRMGFFDGYLDFAKKAELTTKGPSKGGEANKIIREKVGEHLAELLRSPPVGGWKNQFDTIERLSDKVKKFTCENGFERVVRSPDNFIKDSLKNGGKPRDVYLANHAKNKK